MTFTDADHTINNHASQQALPSSHELVSKCKHDEHKSSLYKSTQLHTTGCNTACEYLVVTVNGLSNNMQCYIRYCTVLHNALTINALNSIGWNLTVPKLFEPPKVSDQKYNTIKKYNTTMICYILNPPQTMATHSLRPSMTCASIPAPQVIVNQQLTSSVFGHLRASTANCISSVNVLDKCRWSARVLFKTWQVIHFNVNL